MSTAMAFGFGLLLLSIEPRFRISTNLNGIAKSEKLLLLLKFEKVHSHRILNLNIFEALKVKNLLRNLVHLANAQVLNLLNRAEANGE